MESYNSFDEFCDKWLEFSVTELKKLFADNEKILWLISVALQKSAGAKEGNQHASKEKTNLYNIQDSITGETEIKAPTGTSKEAGLRKLKKHAPTKHQEVLDGKLSVNAAMVESGLRKKTLTISLDPVIAAGQLSKRFSRDELGIIVRLWPLNAF